MWKSISVIILMNGLKIQWIINYEVTSTTKTARLPIQFNSTTSYSITNCVTARISIRVVKQSGNTFQVQTDSSTKYHADFIAIGY